MACTSRAFVGPFFFFLIVSSALQMAVGRNVPTDAKVQLEWLGHDGTVLIPGLGRFMIPKKGTNPFDYDPITGAPKGKGISIPGFGGSTGSAGGGSYIPGGDDTFVPNPGVEVPNPVGGGVPTPSSP